MTRYTESSPGVRSMVRLGVLWALIIASFVVVVGMAVFCVTGEGIEGAALGVGLVPVALGAKVGQKALENKND